MVSVLISLVFFSLPRMAGGLQQSDLDRVNVELKSFGQSLCIGLAVSGTAAGIGILVAATVESIARQPEAADSLNASMNTGIIACVGLVIGAIAATLIL